MEMNDNYQVLMNSKSFIIFLRRYIYNENTLNILKNIITENLCKYDIDINIQNNSLTIISNKSPIEYIVSEIPNFLLRFFKDAYIQSEIVNKLYELKNSSSVSDRTFAEESLQLFNSIICDNNINSIQVLYTTYNVDNTLYIQL